MKKLSKFLVIYLYCVIFGFCYAEPQPLLTKVNSLRIWHAPENTRIVFDVSSQPVYKVQTLATPYKIIIDFKNAKLNDKLIKDLKSNKINSENIKNIATTVLENNIIRVTFTLNEQVKINSFTLKPNQYYGDRLVIDLEPTEKKKILALFDLDSGLQSSKPDRIVIKNNLDNLKTDLNAKNIIIAIDPGHGGEDPGAIGPKGTLEKNVVLAIGMKLKKEINKNPRMRAFLIRNGDYYVSLQQRIAIARKYHADLFLSIHADAFSNAKADGASVFVLSDKGASSAAARWLADSQNQSDTIGGVRITSKKDVLASVLFDLSQTANYAASVAAAKNILNSMQKVVPLHKYEVEHANFAVLKAPDVPSVLIETGFISNPKTELKLIDSAHQNRIVNSIMQGINYYFALQPNRIT